MTMGRPDDSLEPDSCMRCGHRMSVVEETPLDVAGEDVVLVRERCTNCEWEAISAPSILRSDHDLVPAFEPGKTPIGRYRRVVTALSREPGFRDLASDQVAGTLLWYALGTDRADVVIKAHQGYHDEPAVALTKEELFDVWQAPPGRGHRTVTTTDTLRVNLQTVDQLRRFAETDNGAHPRIALVGRPCQLYTVRKLRWDEFLPGYELALGLGMFCFGNFATAHYAGRELTRILGFDPSQIVSVRYGDDFEFLSNSGQIKRARLSDVAGFVSPNCLQCTDFSASFSDLSIGRVGGEWGFEAVVLRTPRGEELFEAAVRDGCVVTSEAVYDGRGHTEDEETRIVRLLTAMVELKKEITRQIH